MATTPTAAAPPFRYAYSATRIISAQRANVTTAHDASSSASCRFERIARRTLTRARLPSQSAFPRRAQALASGVTSSTGIPGEGSTFHQTITTSAAADQTGRESGTGPHPSAHRPCQVLGDRGGGPRPRRSDPHSGDYARRHPRARARAVTKAVRRSLGHCSAWPRYPLNETTEPAASTRKPSANGSRSPRLS